MLYQILANVVLAVHLAFVLFVVAGGLLVLRWRGVMWLHIPAAAWGVVIEFAGWPCPLTPLEKYLRRLGGAEGYEGGFIAHYIEPLLYPQGLTRTHEIIVGVVVLVLNLAIYWWIWRRSVGRRQRESSRS